MSVKPDPEQPERNRSPPGEEQHECEEKMRRSPLRDRLLQLFYWLYLVVDPEVDPVLRRCSAAV